jgi:hypothetical protein
MPSSLPPSTAATVNDAANGAVGSIPLLPALAMTAIATVNNHHCRCHTVDDDDRQKPAVFVCCQQRQRGSSSMEAAVNDNRSNEGLCWRRLSSMAAAVEWTYNDAIALSTMASSADGGSGNGGGRHQLCSSGWCHHHHPFIGINSGGKDAIATATINRRFY